MNRGSAARRGARPPGAVGFNEAPIHESGKSAHRLPAPRSIAGFNEAPIHESGKFWKTL